MRSPALAIAWELGRRHRWGWLAILAYLLALGVLHALGPGAGPAAGLEASASGPEITPRFAATVMVPLSAALGYMLAVFSFGFSGDLAARESIYPARLFTLPITTGALAGWPMLYGTAATTGLWLATRSLDVWPPALQVPAVWPACLVAVVLAWAQALTWMPYGLPGLRVAVTVLWLTTIDAVVVLALHHQAGEGLMVALLAPQVPLAYLVARRAVARARRGDVPDWRRPLARFGRPRAPRRRVVFSGPASAQRWIEWRRHGRSLPVWVGLLLPFELSLLFVARNDRPPLVIDTMLAVLLTPPVMAAFAVASAPGSLARAGGTGGLTPFVATRPLSSAALAASALAATVRATLTTWLLVGVSLPLGLALSGTWPVVIERAGQVMDRVGAPRGIAAALVGVALLVASTWKQLVQGLCVDVTGRARLVKASVFLRLSLFVVVLVLVQWIHDSGGAQALLWSALPWVLAGAVGLKLSAGAWLAARLARLGPLHGGALAAGAAAWAAVVLALHGLLVWLVSTPPLVPRHIPALVAILAVPLVRPAAVPLAVAWNRHRGRPQPSAAKPLRGRTRVVAAAVALVSLPGVLALAEAVSFHVRHADTGSLAISGQARGYRVHVPARNDATRPAPLVISLHGAGGWPALQEATSGWNAVADREGIIVAYPSAASGRSPRVWHGDAAADTAFIAALIDTLARDHAIDLTRVYVDGLSNGGDMAFALSCTLADRIAAVGMVAAAHLLPLSRCADRRPMPAIAFHGTADPIVPYRGGTSWLVRTPLPDIPTWTAAWADRNRCAPTPVASRPAADVARIEYVNCAGNAAVVLYTISGGGHSWPGGQALPGWLVGSTSHAVDATSEMWAFFRARRLAAP